MNQSTRTCSVDGCDDIGHARSLCTKHYQRFRKTGDPTSPMTGNGRNRSKLNLECSLSDCSRPRKARGYCNRHYKRLRATGDPMETPTGMKHERGDKCLVTGCLSAPQTRGLCAKHHARMLKWGDAEYPVREKMSSNKGRKNCARCGGELTADRAWRKCAACARVRSVAKEGIRRAHLRNGVCEHGPDCVGLEFLASVRSRACVYCGDPAKHADHLTPLAGGGLHCIENIVPACIRCNTRKNAKDPLDWLIELAA